MESNITQGFPGDSVVKNLPANAGDTNQSLGWEDTLEKKMAPHSSILAGRSPGTEEPGRPQPMGSQRVDTTEHLSTNFVKRKPYLEHGLQGKYGS